MPVEQIPNDPRLIRMMIEEEEAQIRCHEKGLEGLKELRHKISPPEGTDDRPAVIQYLYLPTVKVLDSMVELRTIEIGTRRGRIEMLTQILRQLETGIVMAKMNPPNPSRRSN